MNSRLISLLIIIFMTGVNTAVLAQLNDNQKSFCLNFKGNWLKASTVNAGDTIVFDLSQAVCSGPYMFIPLSIVSDDVINAVDFSMKFNNNKITFDTTISYKPYLTAAANFNTSDSTLRFSSFSFIQQIEHNTSLAAIRFNFLSGPIVATDFNTITAYLNGDVCSYKFINPVLQTATITAGGPTIFSMGDSVILNANNAIGCTYLWSNGATTQSIKVFISGTYTVTITNPGGCQVSAITNVIVITPLPVQLTDFHLEKTKTEINAKWSATNETNNDYYALERSANCNDWQEIIKVNGLNVSNAINRYSVSDKNPLNGMNYYRLKQTDFNGSYKYSQISSLLFSGKQNEIQLSYFPNPAIDVLNVISSENAIVKIFDEKGKLVITSELLHAGIEKQINVKHIPNGIYLLHIFNDHNSTTATIVIENR